MTRPAQRLTAWLAILAMLLHAGWPLIAQAKPQSSVLVPACTVAGVTHYVELPLDTPLDKRSAAQHEHCQLCMFGAERVAALPAAALPPLLVEAVPHAHASHELVAAPVSRTHAPAQPRAPPLLPL